MKVLDINLALSKFKRMSIDNSEYEFYYQIILNHYEKLIWKLVLSKSPYQIREDIFNECVLKIPGIVKRWDSKQCPFMYYLCMRLKGSIQRNIETMKVVPYPAAKLKFNNKGNTKAPAPIVFIQPEEMNVFPLVYSTIEQDLDWEAYRAEILSIEGGDLWCDFHIEKLKLKEMEDKYGIKKQKITTQLKKIHPIIVTRIKRMMT